LVSVNAPYTFSKYPFSKRKLLLSKWGEHGTERNEVMVRNEGKRSSRWCTIQKNWRAKNARQIYQFIRENQSKKI